MHTLFKGGLLAILAMLSWPAFAYDNSRGKPLEVGVVPYLSARVLVGSYEPMRLYLEQTLGRPVIIYTSTGFKQFFLNAQRGDYDLVLSAAHFARILQKDYRYTPLVRFAAVNHASVVTALNSPIKTPQDLRGQVIAVPDKLSLSTIVVLSSLREIGLQPGTDFHLLEVPSFASAIMSVQKGDTMAAVSSSGILAQMPKELGTSVRTIIDTGEFLRIIFLTHPRIEKKDALLIKQALLKFGNETNEGKQFITSTGSGAIVPVSPKDMSSLDRYMAETKRLMLDKTN
jgi:phosphonate transport system substrate-binding protein